MNSTFQLGNRRVLGKRRILLKYVPPNNNLKPHPKFGEWVTGDHDPTDFDKVHDTSSLKKAMNTVAKNDNSELIDIVNQMKVKSHEKEKHFRRHNLI